MLRRRVFLVLLMVTFWLMPEARAQAAAEQTPSAKAQRSAEDLLREADAAKHAGDMKGAIAIYEQAVQAGPRAPRVRWEYGTTLYDLDQYERARDQFRVLVELAPSNGLSFAMLGLSEFELKSFGDARVHLQRAAK